MNSSLLRGPTRNEPIKARCSPHCRAREHQWRGELSLLRLQLGMRRTCDGDFRVRLRHSFVQTTSLYHTFTQTKQATLNGELTISIMVWSWKAFICSGLDGWALYSKWNSNLRNRNRPLENTPQVPEITTSSIIFEPIPISAQSLNHSVLYFIRKFIITQNRGEPIPGVGLAPSQFLWPFWGMQVRSQFLFPRANSSGFGDSSTKINLFWSTKMVDGC